MRQKVLNAKGQEIVLNDLEQRIADYLQNQLVSNPLTNALGYEIDITTLTTIIKKVTEQKFFEIAPAEYMPITVGNGAWSHQLTTYRSFALADDFATGLINTGGNNGRLAQADAGVDAVNVKVNNWAKEIGWSLFDLQLASKSGNWDLISAKEESRKKNWDLGIQKVAFLGISGDSSTLGLYNQAGVTVDTTTLTQAIKSLSTVDLKAFCANILNVYRSNCNRTAWPTHFIIPESDYLGLAAPVSADFPIKSVLAQLEEAFTVMTKKPFKILPSAYGDLAYSGQSYQQYVLLNYDEKSLRMDLPVDYTNTLANSINNFSFQNVGYGQFTGLQAYRPLEMYYLRFTP